MRFLLAFACLLATEASALDLNFTNARTVIVETDDAGSTRLPEVPWSPGSTTSGTEGAIRKTVLEFPGGARTSLQLISPIRLRLEDDGYRNILSCANAECGGFDFRFQLDLIGEPHMHVDLGDYRYLLMRKDGAEPHSVALLASPAIATGFVHITEVSTAVLTSPTPSPENQSAALEVPNPSADQTDRLIEALIDTGHAVLSDLDFSVGSSQLGAGPFSSLEQLSAWLAENPTARVILVGHTDAVGSLASNTTLSQRRAAEVSNRLATAYGTARGQLQAAGAGYLAPTASNLTPEGRAANRRVEVVLLSLN
ncbi:OmpA family protein [Rhodobacteraceae bacterium]|nr:OmpA family protein [Paracoccaceae bacterium]